MLTRSDILEDGLGPADSDTRSSNAFSSDGPTDQQLSRPGSAARTGWIWLRYTVSLVLVASMIGNLIQSALCIEYFPLYIVHGGILLCWFIYFPMMMYCTYTGRESKEVYARNELVVMIGLMAPPVGSLIITAFQLVIWERDGTLGTSLDIYTERNSLIATLAISSFQIAMFAAWAIGIYILVKGRDYRQGGEMRWKTTVHSLIRRQPVPRKR